MRFWRGKRGEQRVSLLRTHEVGIHPGVHQLPDGIIVVTSDTTFLEIDGGCSVVSVRCKIEEIDALAARAKP